VIPKVIRGWKRVIVKREIEKDPRKIEYLQFSRDINFPDFLEYIAKTDSYFIFNSFSSLNENFFHSDYSLLLQFGVNSFLKLLQFAISVLLLFIKGESKGSGLETMLILIWLVVLCTVFPLLLPSTVLLEFLHGALLVSWIPNASEKLS
jgi:hypothetical protein